MLGHSDILKHSQLNPLNKNGPTLQDCIIGKQHGHSPPDVHIHNTDSTGEWTHATPDGKWVQINYIITSGELSARIAETIYSSFRP